MSLNILPFLETALRDGRQREGLEPSRFKRLLDKGNSSGKNWKLVSETDFFKQVIEELDQPAEICILKYLKVVASRIDSKESKIIDSTLNLKIYESCPGGLLEERRDAQRRSFESMSKTTYRNNFEEKALSAFAVALDNPIESDLEKLGVNHRSFSKFLTNNPSKAPNKAKIVVLGGAVMDINFLIPSMPRHNTSVQAKRFKLFPGGKGLTQAVACARLGLETQLISIVGDDSFGNDILSFLEEENVDTSLVKIKKAETSAVTGVFIDDSNESSAIGWKNEHKLHFPLSELKNAKRDAAISDCDFFLSSFELPSDVVEHGIKRAKQAGATTILTPAPPYDSNLLEWETRKNVDFLVSNLWELKLFANSDKSAESENELSDIAKEFLISSGIRNLVITHEQSCHTYYRNVDKQNSVGNLKIPTSVSKFSESPGERDAFCAMLCLKLSEHKKENINMPEVFTWATAAMCCVKSDLGIPLTMPKVEDVNDWYNHIFGNSDSKPT